MSLASKLSNFASKLIGGNVGKFLSFDANGDAYPVPVPMVSGLYRNLKLSASGANANIIISVDEICLGDGAGNFLNFRGWSGTLNTATSGVNGLDTGTIVGASWYYVFAIAKLDGTKGFLASASSTAPTLPSGYTLFNRIGAFRTDGTANKFPFQYYQTNRTFWYIPGNNLAQYPTIWDAASNGDVSGGVQSMATFAPPTAVAVNVYSFGTPGASGNTVGSVGPLSAMAFIYVSTPGSTAAVGSSVWIPLNNYSLAVNFTRGTGTAYALFHGWEDSI